MDLARAPCRAPLTARKMGSGYENDICGYMGFTLFNSYYFNNFESVPVFFSENGTPWDFLRKKAEILIGIF
jgi:hypothetical protein